jgi:calcineurin-like phosphoesterase family protein
LTELGNKIFFTADTHFGHRSIMLRFNRPFKNVKHMDTCLIRNWNSTVSPFDYVYHLGDFGYGLNTQEIFDQLNGVKHLIVGNHDTKQVLTLGWASIRDKGSLRIGDCSIWLSHKPTKPPRVKMQKIKRQLRLHGHNHTYPGKENMCVDVCGFVPISLNTIIQRFK